MQSAGKTVKLQAVFVAYAHLPWYNESTNKRKAVGNMEEQELRCPWCGGPLEKGQLWGDSYGFVTEGVKVATHNIFKRVTEKENYGNSE